jgi:protocatechuate 3,4-dioxygenase beta subunit
MFVEGRVLDTKGNAIAGAIIDTWEADASGKYDTEVIYPFPFPFHVHSLH